MSKNKYVIPPDVLEVLGPPPLLASESPKQRNETLARFARSFPPKNEDDFEGWKYVWNLACDHREEERMKRFKVEFLEAPQKANWKQELLARVAKMEDELGTQALERAFANFQGRYGLPRSPVQSDDKLPAETKGLVTETDPKLPAEMQPLSAVTATEPAPLLPPTDADYADAFAQNMDLYICCDQIQNSARKRYDAVRYQFELRRAAELAAKMVNREVAPTERQLQDREGSSAEHLSDSVPAPTSVLLSSIQPFTPGASPTETSMSVQSTQLLEPPNSPEPEELCMVSSAADAVGAIEPSIVAGETSGSASSQQCSKTPNLAEPQAPPEASIGSMRDAAPVVELSTAVDETTKSASSPQYLEAPDSCEPPESSELSTASAMGVPPAIDPSTAVGKAGPARVTPGMHTNDIDSNVATDLLLAKLPAARESSPRTSINSTAVTASDGPVIAGAPMAEVTPAADRKDEGDRVESPGTLVQPSQQKRVPSAQKESEADRVAGIRGWVREEIARRDAERARGRSG
jgi:hypothetical protein